MPAGRRGCRAYHIRPRKGAFLFVAKKCVHSDIYICDMSTEGKYVVKGGFYIKARELKAAVKRFKYVIPKGDSDEILKRLLMHQMKHTLVLEGSDGEMYATSILNVEPIEGSVLDPSMAVSYYSLRDYLKHVPEETLLKCVFAENEKGIPYMLIENEQGRQPFHGICSCNYPKAPKFHCSNIAIMEVDDFRDMVARTIFAADEMPYSRLGGVYFHCLPDRTRFIATNRAILSMYERTDIIFPKPESVVVPKRFLQAFVAGINAPHHGKNVLIYICDGHIMLSGNGFSLFSKCLSEDFPDYERVIPKEPKYTPILKRDDLIGVIKQLLAFANQKTSRINLFFDEAKVAVSAEIPVHGMSKTEKLPCKYSGDAPTWFRISFNAKLLLSILENLKSEYIVMKMASSGRNVVILPEPQNSKAHMLCLIAPLLVEE